VLLLKHLKEPVQVVVFFLDVQDHPDTKQQADILAPKVSDIPALMLLGQNGEEDKGWRGLPFWWLVVVTPRSAVTSIFANDEPSVS
jgi:hypothetical protein